MKSGDSTSPLRRSPYNRPRSHEVVTENCARLDAANSNAPSDAVTTETIRSIINVREAITATRRIPVLASHSDSDLMRQVRDGELDSLAILFERHHRSLFAYLQRMTGSRAASEDLVQEVFFRILKYRATYFAGNPFSTWMYQIARNAYLDWIKKRKGETWLDEQDRAASIAAPGPGPEHNARRAQEVDLLRRALDRLPAEKREVLILARFQNLSYDQIATILSCEVNTVKVRVFRAMKELTAEYQQIAQERRV